MNDGGISEQEALALYDTPQEQLPRIFKAAADLARQRFADKVNLCAIVNAKSGNCPEDCGFCAQSARSRSDIKRYPMISADEIVDNAREATSIKATCFGIITSGKGVASEKEIDIVCEALVRIRKELPQLNPSCSLGIISEKFLKRLKEAGLGTYHHNLETAPSYFKNICTTHTFEDRIETINRAKEAGLKTCCGGIFGLGETPRQRVEFLFAIKKVNPDSVPLNFLNPIKGTSLENNERLAPIEILKIIALARLTLPDKNIQICGGRNVNLGEYEKDIFSAGASGMMIGNYLTTAGNDPQDDLRMIEKLGLEPK